jgi:hypothetical protein
MAKAKTKKKPKPGDSGNPVDLINKPLVNGALSPLQITAVILKGAGEAAFEWQKADRYSVFAVKQRYPRIDPNDIPEQRWMDWLSDAVAICLAESKGVVTATHTNDDGSKDWGLYQINDVHKASFPLLWAQRLEAVANVKMAAGVFRGAGHSWGPWSTYEAGYGSFTAYKNVGNECAGYVRLKGELALNEAYTEAIGGMFPLVHAAAGVADFASDPLGGILAFVKQAGAVIGLFVLGLLLLAIGLWAAMRETKAGRAVTNVNPISRVLKATK